MNTGERQLGAGDILRLVNDYIGAEQAGHIGDFTFRTLAEFYPQYCGLSVDVDGLRATGHTKRSIFLHILQNADRRDQARIIRGTLKKYPPGDGAFPGTHRAELMPEFERLASRLECGAAVEGESLAIQSGVVERAIDDAATLLRTTGATSGVDRVHTALHGYLMAICRDAAITFEDRATMTQLLKRILAEHAAVNVEHPRAGDVKTVLKAMGSILDALNPIRNQASVAHPTEHLLEEDEAVLVVDAARTVLNYLNRKLTAVE